MIGERDVTYLPPKDRNISMVFQSYAIFPHMKVYDNIAFGLKMKRVPKVESAERVKSAAELLHIEDFLERYPSQLSGGQRQRVAVARAIAVHAQVLLMDEPLSNLDALLRLEMRAELKRLLAILGATTIYVTHDQIEALSMGDRIAVMRNGRILQFDNPTKVYDAPGDHFVGGFIGTPPMNFLEGQVRRADGALRVYIDQFALQPIPEMESLLAQRDGKPVLVGIRAENMEPLNRRDARRAASRGAGRRAAGVAKPADDQDRVGHHQGFDPPRFPGQRRSGHLDPLPQREDPLVRPGQRPGAGARSRPTGGAMISDEPWRLDPAHGVKPLDFGAEGLTGSVDPHGRLIALNIYHPRYGYATLTTADPFPEDRRYDPAAVRAYRAGLAELAGFGPVFVSPVVSRDAFLLEHAIPHIRLTLADGTQAECTTFVAKGGAIQVWQCPSAPRWRGRLSLQRCAYTQLTEGGPVEMPPVETYAEFADSMLTFHNPALGLAAAISWICAGRSVGGCR